MAMVVENAPFPLQHAASSTCLIVVDVSQPLFVEDALLDISFLPIPPSTILVSHVLNLFPTAINVFPIQFVVNVLQVIICKVWSAVPVQLPYQIALNATQVPFAHYAVLV